MFNEPKLPNLELMEFKARLFLKENEVYKKKKTEKESVFRDNMVFDAEMFPQWWGSTCGPFDIDKNGNPVVACSAMTKMYTTVFHETTTDMYVIFFGDSLGYMIHDAKSQFVEDLKEHNLASLGMCLKTDRY